jgi:hypothetical protein
MIQIKGYIYSWIFDNKVVYIGRTTQTLEIRTKGHKLEFEKQKKNGFITKKFIEVSKLPNQWDDIKVKLVEEVDDIATLGDRELYWFNIYSKDFDLWNSILPSDSEFMVLSLEQRLALESDKSFMKFLDSFMYSTSRKIIRKFEALLWEERIVPINKQSFKISEPKSVIDANEIFKGLLNEYVNEMYFTDLVTYIISNQEKLFINGSLLMNSDKIIQIDFEDLNTYLQDIDLIDVNDLKEYFLKLGFWAFLSNREKKQLNQGAVNLLQNFSNEYKSKINGIKYVPIFMSHRRILNNRIRILEEMFADFSNTHYIHIPKLVTFLRGGKVNLSNYVLKDSVFLQSIGRDNLNRIFTDHYYKKPERLIVKGYEIEKIYKIDFKTKGEIIYTLDIDNHGHGLAIEISMDVDHDVISSIKKI